MIYNPHNLTSYVTHEEVNEEVDEILALKKKKTLGLRLGHLKHHAHVKKAEETLVENQKQNDDRTM